MSKQTSIGFTFSGNIIPDKTISVSFEQEKLANILTFLFENTAIDYKFIDGQIVLFEKEQKAAKLFTISGYIKDVETERKINRCKCI